MENQNLLLDSKELSEISDNVTAVNENIEVSFTTCLDRFIPDSEKPSEDNLPEGVKQALGYGFLTQAAGMGQLKNCFNDSVYAAICIDEKENRSIQFCQRYEDGEFSALFTIPQETLLTVAMGKQYPEMEKDSKRCIKSIVKEYFRKATGKELLPIRDVLEVLLQQLPNLPVISTKARMTPAQLYADIMGILQNWTNGPLSNPHQVREGFIALGPCDVDYIASELEMTTQSLLKVLKSNRLLHLTESCDGYQAKISQGRDEKGKMIYHWAYCLYDIEYATKKLSEQGVK